MKSNPNHGMYIQTLRRMGPGGRLEKAFELSELATALFRSGLRRRHPELADAEFERLFRARVEKARNRKA